MLKRLRSWAPILLLIDVMPFCTRGQLFQVTISRHIIEGQSGAGDNLYLSEPIPDPTGHTVTTVQTQEQSFDFGQFQKELPQKGLVPLASFTSMPSQDTTVVMTDTNVTASGVLKVKATGSSQTSGNYVGSAYATLYSYFDLTISVTQPMGVIFHVTTSNAATDGIDPGGLRVPDGYQNLVQLVTGNQFLQYGDVAGPNVIELHNPTPPGNVVLRIAPDPNVNGSQAVRLVIDVQEGVVISGDEFFSYERSLNFTFALQPLVDLPQFTSFDVIAPNPARSTSTWKFTAAFPSALDGLAVRVESSPTGEDGTWSALSGNSLMRLNNGVYTLTSHDIPTGTQFFRAVANSPLATAPITSNPRGPYDVQPGFEPPFGEFQVFPWEANKGSGIYQPGTYSFYITGPDPVPNLRVHVQYAYPDRNGNPPDPDSSSWQDLEGGANMNRLGSSLFNLDSNRVPFGQKVYYRVVASAPGYEDMYSDVSRWFELDTLVRQSEEFSSDRSLALADLTADLVLAKNCADVTIDTSSLPPTPVGALALEANDCGKILLKIYNDVTVAGGAIVAGDNTLVENQGKIRGDLILASASKIVAQGGGNIVAQGGGNIVAQGGGNFTLGGAVGFNFASVALIQQASSIVAAGAGNFVGASAANIVAQGGGNLISPNGSNATQAGGNPAVPLSARSAEPKFTALSAGDNQVPQQRAFTGVMNVDGNYTQYAGTLYLAIAGTNTTGQGAQQYDQLKVTGRAELLEGSIAVGLFDPNNQTNLAGAFQPPIGSTFDVVIAKSIVLRSEFAVRGQVFADGRFFHWNVVDRADGTQALRLSVTNVPPLLGVLVSSNSVEVGYAANYSSYVIQSSPAVLPASWITVSSTTNVVTFPSTNRTAFFRLIKP